jgi:hypothetical protein
MNDTELDALLSTPLPERDAAEFSVTLMEQIAHDAARPARIASWIMVGVLFALIAAACVFGAALAGRNVVSNPLVIATALIALTLLLSHAVFRSAKEA